jgi:hypothetical protein
MYVWTVSPIDIRRPLYGNISLFNENAASA